MPTVDETEDQFRQLTLHPSQRANFMRDDRYLERAIGASAVNWLHLRSLSAIGRAGVAH